MNSGAPNDLQNVDIHRFMGSTPEERNKNAQLIALELKQTNLSILNRVDVEELRKEKKNPQEYRKKDLEFNYDVYQFNIVSELPKPIDMQAKQIYLKVNENNQLEYKMINLTGDSRGKKLEKITLASPLTSEWLENHREQVIEEIIQNGHVPNITENAKTFKEITIRSNKLTNIVISDILSVESKEEQKSIFDFYLQVMENSFHLGDLESAVTIANALKQSEPIARLDYLLDEKSKEKLENVLNKYTKAGRKQYQEEIYNKNISLIPTMAPFEGEFARLEQIKEVKLTDEQRQNKTPQEIKDAERVNINNAADIIMDELKNVVVQNQTYTEMPNSESVNFEQKFSMHIAKSDNDLSERSKQIYAPVKKNSVPAEEEKVKRNNTLKNVSKRLRRNALAGNDLEPQNTIQSTIRIDDFIRFSLLPGSEPPLSEKSMDKHIKLLAIDMKKMNVELFAKFEDKDLDIQDWKDYPMTKNWHALANMVTDDILRAESKEHRQNVFAFYVKVANQSVKKGDFQTASAIYAGLTSLPVGKLDYLKEGNINKEYKKMESILSRSAFGEYYRIMNENIENKKTFIPSIIRLVFDITKEEARDGNKEKLKEKIHFMQDINANKNTELNSKTNIAFKISRHVKEDEKAQLLRANKIFEKEASPVAHTTEQSQIKSTPEKAITAPESVAQGFVKWMKQNKLAAAVLGAALVLSVLGVSILTGGIAPVVGLLVAGGFAAGYYGTKAYLDRRDTIRDIRAQAEIAQEKEKIFNTINEDVKPGEIEEAIKGFEKDLSRAPNLMFTEQKSAKNTVVSPQKVEEETKNQIKKKPNT